jgi:glycosyltransferase involved in cell wall biosynthesis
MTMTLQVSLIVFAYNEEENVTPVLQELMAYLREHHPRTQIVFVDDGSTDATFERAERALAGENAVLLRHASNRGIGAALKTGVRRCTADWVTFMPADGQIPPSAVTTLLKAAETRELDVVFSNYENRDDGWHRALLSWGVRALIVGIHGVALHSEGPYLFRRNLFDPDALPPDTFFLNFEFPIRMLVAKRRTNSVIIPCRQRRAGVSKSTGIKRIAGVAQDLLLFRVRRIRESLS